MPLKKRLFRSNMTILFLALASLMFLVILIAALFEDAFLDGFESMDNAELDENMHSVREIINQENTEDWNQLEQEIQKYGYKLLVLKDNEVVYGNHKKEEEELLKEFDVASHAHTTPEPEIYYHQKATVVGKYAAESSEYVMAIHFSKGEWWVSTFRNSFAVFIAAFILIGAAAIVVLLTLSSFFTRRMARKIMEPLDALVRGAGRIKEGNLTEDIVYKGDEEFENVCDTFNSMQKTMSGDRAQQLKNEKARRDMITGISHDLRTPLTSIQGYIKGILDGVADTEEKKSAYLQTAYEATGEMNVLLQKLFEFSRMESGQMPFHMVRGDLAEFAASYTAQREGVTDKEKVEISFVKDAEVLPEIQMDIEQIRRIFDNLLENSVKYAGIIPVKIRIHIYELESSVVMEWSDNGKGVPQEKLENIFERFYRCDESRTEKGSGVGLYVVKYIVEQHGGEITAQNREGLMVKMSFPKGD